MRYCSRGAICGRAESWPQMEYSPTSTACSALSCWRAAATREGNYRLETATLYVTLEPCAMCVGAAINARVARVVFGAWDQKAGACGSVFDLPREPGLAHRLDIFGGVCAEACSALLR